MAECIKCEISDEKALLFDAISREGVVKICKKCNKEEGLPLINQVKHKQGIERERNVYNRLAKYAGINPVEHRKKFGVGGEIKESSIDVDNKKLKDIVDENYKKKVSDDSVSSKKRDDLIYNFHWLIMRERRKRKLTQSQLAREIQEPESAIKLIEQGYLPEKDWEKLIMKLEIFLRINISKKPVIVSDDTRYRERDPTKIKVQEDFKETGNFDLMTTKHLTISDLKRMKKEKSLPSSKSVSTNSEYDKEEFLDPFQETNLDKNKNKKWWKRNKEYEMGDRDLTPEEVEKIIRS